MSDNAGAAGPEPGNRVAIGITFGNTNSSIAYTVDDKAEVIANEDGGTYYFIVVFFILSLCCAASCAWVTVAINSQNFLKLTNSSH
jgi:molecular chaperone DnaK (HSP70)